MKLLLLDKDGTLVIPRSGQQFVQAPWDQEPLPGVMEAIAHYAINGWTPVIVSNQAGIAAGHKTLEETFQEMRFCLELFPRIKESYFCPDFEGSECWRCWGSCSEQHRIWRGRRSYETQELELQGLYRKPSPGMLRLAIATHVPEEILMVGDRPEDEAAAQAAGVPFQWAAEWVKP